jgi:Flp pilus assembly protein TadG
VGRKGGAARRLRDEAGQATVELVAAVPALLLAALLSLQLLAAGYALTLADGAAEAGALALAEGGSAAEAARDALPGWAAADVSVAVRGEEVLVRLRPPSPFGAVADHLAVTSTASARSAE